VLLHELWHELDHLLSPTLYAAAEFGGYFSETFISCRPTFSSSSANLQVNEVSINNRQDLLRAQENDSEIVSLSQYAVDEREAVVIPYQKVC